MSDYSSGFVSHYIPVADGLKLYSRVYGAEHGGLPVVCLPGLSRNSRDFHQLALLLSSRSPTPLRVITIDSRGRGLSDKDEKKERYTIPTEAQDAIAVLDHFGLERALFIGTSRGGLILHILAATHPERLAGVVLNDIGPVIETEGLKQIQDYLGRERRPENFDDAAAILKETHGPSFPALSEADWRDMADAIYREIDGKLVADFDPAIAEQFRAADLSQAIPDLWAQFDLFRSLPLMAIRGENSRLLSKQTAEAMAERHPDMRLLTAPGQGHAPILHLGGIPAELHTFLTGVR
ncbi:alpha/beta hydrolase [Rhizobium sp. ACO-34A]|nr:alpha/beta hydrolase [Rhizobium sp. ACO-34A]ATN33696.1 alpha/beta hydrolase [Rhizobium sp. ACO-34A]